MSLYRPWLIKQNILASQDLANCANGQRVRVTGLVQVHQSPPTAKGFHFLILQSEAGLIDVIISPQIDALYRRLPHTAPLLIVEGIVQRQDEVVNLLAQRVQPCQSNRSPRHDKMTTTSRLLETAVGYYYPVSQKAIELSLFGHRPP